MKKKKKHIAASVLSVALAGILAAGALLRSGVSVEASSAMMPGIETIVNEVTEKKPLRILEIVDHTEEAEIGYYVSGQEPFLKLFRYETTDGDGNPVSRSFATVEEALAVLPEEARKAFVENTLPEGGSTGIKNIQGLCGDDVERYPLSFTPYQETYFLSEGEEGWKQIDFEDGKPRPVQLPGHYEQVNPGEGDYVKGEISYYPVREDIPSDSEKAKYQENIRGFAYSGSTTPESPYLVDFSPVTDADGSYITKFSEDMVRQAYDYRNGGYGYYENIYRELRNDTDFLTFPGEKKLVSGEAPVLEEAQAEDAFTSGEAFGAAGLGAETFGSEGFGSGDLFGDTSSSGDADYGKPMMESTENNPMIYRAELIQSFPNYKYIPFKTLTEIKQSAIEYPGKASELATGKITFDKNGVYRLWTVDSEFGARWEYLYYVQGRQQISPGNIRSLPENYYPQSTGDAFDDGGAVAVMPYYYQVSGTAFSCAFEAKKDGDTPETAEKSPEAYRYGGWYYALTPGNEPLYVETETEPTFYASEAKYSLTPGKGNYVFVPDEGESEVTVEVNHFYYKGGYRNHDWLKRYVFHLSPEDEETREQFESFYIEVDTVLAEEAERFSGKKAEALFFSEEALDMAEVSDSSGASDFGEFSDSGEFFDGDASSDGDASHGETGGETPGADAFTDWVEVEPMVSETMETPETAEFFAGNEESIADSIAEEEEPWEATESFMEDGDFSSETPEFSADSGEEELFSASASSDTGETDFSDYDLIYINGSLSAKTAKALAELQIPCIINEAKLTEELKTGLADYLKEDGDGHYVNGWLYMFKDTASGNSLVNLAFHTPFYSPEGGNLEGFEEILEYIESENQYRELGASEGDGFTDGSPQYEALSLEISQARAVEYILNYRLRRPRNLKDCIKVLEIQPANPVGTLKEETVREWIYGETSFINPTACCASSAEPPANLVDGDKNTIWHNSYNTLGSACKDKEPWFTVEIKGNPSNIGGVSYTPRQNNNNNGKAVKYRVEALDGNKQPINGFTVTGDFSSNTYKDTKQIMFENAAPGNAKYIRFSFLNPGNKYASCAEFEPVGKLRVEITTMTSSEFVGHVDDINAKYDLLYFGDDSSAPYYLDLRNGGEVNGVKRLYAHTGAARKYDSGNNKFYTKFLGLLNTDYHSSTQMNHPSVNNNQIGIFRGSGNDITAQQVRELNSFAASGYPVVLADGLVKDGKIRTETVDSASYMYEFLNGALPRENVLAESEITGNRTLAFYANLAKPQLIFEQGGLPPEPQRLNNSVYKYNAEAGVGNLSTSEEGLRFEFRIRNDSEISMANASYNCELFLDLNFDGNLSETENQASYIQIQERDSGKILTAFTDGGKPQYNLKLDTAYVLTRKIPEDYFKIITWKLDVSRNENRNIRTSRLGFTKRTAKEKQKIKVLQIQSNVNNTWDLKYPPEHGKKPAAGTFQDLISKVQDFEITVDTTTVSGYESAYKKNNSYLDNYQMLIIGFADGYPNAGVDGKDFQNEDAVKAILEFARAGKSVIFTHDTTSFVNWPYPTVSKGNALYGRNETIPNVWEWGYPLNSQLRTEVGMDRYGIVSKEQAGSTTVSEILKEGNSLDSGMAVWNAVRGKVSDMAYEYGNPNRSSFMTQGYANNTLLTNDNCATTWASKVNDGAITQYPYYIGDMIQTTKTHSQYYQLAMETDRNEDNKNDIVVWYCLAQGSDGNAKFGESPNDVRNNYYFYSKGNIIYTGVGHTEVKNNSDTMQETQLFVNAIVAAAAVTAVSPDISFVEELNPAARPENVRYYMTNQMNFFSGESNVLEKDMEFYFNVRDYNMVGASLDPTQEIEQKMTVEFYVQDRNGNLYEGAPSDAGELLPLGKEIPELLPYGEGKPVLKDETGRFTLPKNNAYGFRIEDMERYLYENTGAGDYYKSGCKLYAKVTSTVNLYGKPVTSTSWAALDLRQRQLFDMD